MYDLLTSSLLFVILVPGVALTLPPSGGLAAALLHAVVFYVIQAFVSQYVPWWGIWIVAIVVILGKWYASRSAAAAPMY
jgi:hypothetical protein